MNLQKSSHDLSTYKWSIVLFLVYAVYLFSLFQFNWWQWVGVGHRSMEGADFFVDMFAILAALDSHQAGFNVYYENPYDGLGRLHVYPRVWLWLGHLGLGREHIYIVGIALLVLFMLFAVRSLAPRDAKEFLLAVLMLFSSVVTLAVERANNELVIVLLFAVAAYLLANSGGIRKISAYAALFLSGALKLYPFAAFSVCVWHEKERGKFLWTALSSLFFIVLFIMFSYQDLLRIIEIMPKPGIKNIYVFGARLLFFDIDIKWFFIGSLLAVGLTVLLSKKLSAFSKEAPPEAVLLFIMSATALAASFFINTNFDYRCLLFIPTLSYFFWLKRRADINRFTRVSLFMYFVFLGILLWSSLLMNLTAYAGRSMAYSNETINAWVGLVMLLKQAASWFTILTLTAFLSVFFKVGLLRIINKA